MLLASYHARSWKLQMVTTTGHKVTGIHGKRERERKQNTETGTCKNWSDSWPVRFTELYKPNHWYAIVVKFFFELFLLHKALSNKRPCNSYSISNDRRHFWTFIIIQFFYLAYLTLTAGVCYNCFKIWLNNLKVQCKNNTESFMIKVFGSVGIYST